MPGFTDLQWSTINRKLRQNPKKYGMPIRRDGSVLIGSFNALKLGKATSKAKHWQFLRKFVSRYDLLAVQEIMDDLSGIRRLHKSLGPSFEMIVSDTTGAVPGKRGLKERLAFFYRPARIELKELVSDITYDRSIITATLRENFNTWRKFFRDINKENKIRISEGKKEKTLTEFAHPAFLSFIRTPHCASFSIKSKNGADPIDFLGVNAHTLYGKSKDERDREFFALLNWIVNRAKSRDSMYFKNMIVMADLNMQFKNEGQKWSDIIKLIIDLEKTKLRGNRAARVNFPFLNVHPKEIGLYRTNARKDETFDHVGIFIDRDEKGLPRDDHNKRASLDGPNGYDFGVFDFMELFSQSRHEKHFYQLTELQTSDLRKRAMADVSDHMPIWVRIPIPGI